MNTLQKPGGVAALVEAATYLFGILVAFTFLAPTWDLEPAQYVAFLAENHTFMHLWHLVIYVVNAIFLVVLVLALHERLRGGAPAVSQVAAAIGLIWAGLVLASGLLTINDLNVVTGLYASNPEQAAVVWLALSAVEQGIGGAVELPGGLWIALVSWAALQGRGLPSALCYLGFLVGAAGIVSAVPGLGDLGVIFGLGSIIWFLWLGAAMLRSGAVTQPVRPSAIVPQPEPAN